MNGDDEFDPNYLIPDTGGGEVSPPDTGGGGFDPNYLVPAEPTAAAAPTEAFDPSYLVPDKQPQAEGMLATGAREAAHGVLPTLAGIATGARLGAMGGAAFGLPGALIGGVGGAIVGGVATSMAQESGLKALGFDDSHQRAINAKTNPASAFAGEVAPMALGFGPGAVSKGMRVASAAIGGGLEAGHQVVQGEFDPMRLAGGVAAGAVLAKPRGWVEAAGLTPGRPDVKAVDAYFDKEKAQTPGTDTPGADASPGIAEPSIKPSAVKVDDQQIGVGSERDYPAVARTDLPAKEPGFNVVESDPAIDMAIRRAVGGEAEVGVAPGTPEAAGAARYDPARIGEIQGDTILGAGPNMTGRLHDGTEVPISAGANALFGGPKGDIYDPRVFSHIRRSGESEWIPVRDPQAAPGSVTPRTEAEPVGEAVKRIIPEDIPTDPRALRGIAQSLRNGGNEGRARQFELAADAIEQSQGGRQQQQQLQPEPAAPPPGAPPPGAPPPGGAPPPSAAPAVTPRDWKQQLFDIPRRLGQEVQNIFAPHLRSDRAQALGQTFNREYGITERVFRQTEHLGNQHAPTIMQMGPEDRAALMNRAQGGNDFPNWVPNQAQTDALNALKVIANTWERELRGLDRASQMEFLENFLPGMYKNEEAAKAFLGERGYRAGGAGSLMKKTFANYEEAKRAGHVPLTDNPFELMQRYGQTMKNFIAKNAVKEHAIESGLMGYFNAPKTIGAAGSPTPKVVAGENRPPPGWVASKWESPRFDGKQLYMPEEIVNVYDNFYSTGLRGKFPTLYDAARSSNVAMTRLMLSVNGYHAFTMAHESIALEMQRALENLVQGKFRQAGETALRAPLAPYRLAREGSRVQEEYLKRNSSDPVIKALEHAGFRPIGVGHAPDVQISNQRQAFVTSLKDIPGQLEKAVKDVKQDWLDAKGNLPAQMKYPFQQAGRLIDTMSHALFNVYIPKMKAGAAYEMMKHWSEANPHLALDSPEAQTAANKIVGTIDNQFGEAVTDRQFMNKVVQDGALAGLTSYSWLRGSLTLLGGGAGRIARTAMKAENPLKHLDPRSMDYDPRVAYTIAFPASVAMLSTIYQGLFGSHDLPKGISDLYAPRTGGTTPGVGGKGKIPEHMLMPGYQKEIYGWTAHPGQEAYNKIGSLWQTIIEELSNKDWRNMPIQRPNASFIDAFNDRLTHISSKLGPISVKAAMKGLPEGSNIPAAMQLVGFRPTSKAVSAPEQSQAARYKREAQEWNRKIQTENREAKQRGLPPPWRAQDKARI